MRKIMINKALLAIPFALLAQGGLSMNQLSAEIDPLEINTQAKSTENQHDSPNLAETASDGFSFTSLGEVLELGADVGQAVKTAVKTKVVNIAKLMGAPLKEVATTISGIAKKIGSPVANVVDKLKDVGGAFRKPGNNLGDFYMFINNYGSFDDAIKVITKQEGGVAEALAQIRAGFNYRVPDTLNFIQRTDIVDVLKAVP